MGRQFGLIAVLTLMVLVIEFTPGCHGRTLSSKHHHHHHPSDDYPPQDGNGASGDFYPPPPQDGSGGNGDYYPQDGNGDSGDRHYGQPPQGGSGGSGNHPHPPPQGGSGGSGNYPPPSQDESDVSDDRGYSPPPPHPHPHPPPTTSSPPSEDLSDSFDDSEDSDETAGKSFAQLKTLLTLLRSRVATLSSPPQGGASHRPPPPDFSDLSGVSELIDLFDEDSESREDSEDSDDSAEESSINSHPGNFSGSDAEAIRELVIKIAQHIGLLDDEWKVHWDAMLALKEEQVDDVIKAVSEFVGKHFADHAGKIDWKAIAQALFGDGGLISGDYNSASSE